MYEGNNWLTIKAMIIFMDSTALTCTQNVVFIFLTIFLFFILDVKTITQEVFLE